MGRVLNARALQVLRRRLPHWGVNSDEINESVGTLGALLSFPLPSCIKFAVLRTVCNAWNTTARYQQPIGACIFGCLALAKYRLPHYLACPVMVRVVVLRILDLDVPAHLGSPLLLLLLRRLAAQATWTANA